MAETIFEALRESHKIQRSLIRRLMLSDPGEHRVDVFGQLRRELAAHEAAEERFLYVDMLMDDRGLDASRDALSDHHKMDKQIEGLQQRDHSGRRWMSIVKNLSDTLHEHLREEEKKYFQLAGKILNDAQKTSLAKKYRKNYEAMHKKLAASD